MDKTRINVRTPQPPSPGPVCVTVRFPDGRLAEALKALSDAGLAFQIGPADAKMLDRRRVA